MAARWAHVLGMRPGCSSGGDGLLTGCPAFPLSGLLTGRVEICGGKSSDKASLGVDHGDRARVAGDQLGCVAEVLVGIEKHGVVHHFVEFVVGLSLSEGLGVGDSEELAIEGDDDMLVGGEVYGVGDPHVGSKRGWRLHELVHAGWSVFDDDGSVRGLGLDAGAGAEELALEPRSAGSSYDEERSCG